MRRNPFLLAGVILLALAALHAQGPATGVPPFSSVASSSFDTIDLGNLNIHFAVSMINKPGRGMPFIFGLTYDSSLWYIASVSGVNTWQPVANFGWQTTTNAPTGYIRYADTSGTCNDSSSQYYNQSFTISQLLFYSDSGGTQHPLGVSVAHVPTGFYCAGFLGSSATGTATDGSGYTVNASYSAASGLSATITSRSGLQLVVPLVTAAGPFTGAGSVTDRNGNQITTTNGLSFTDTLNTAALTISGAPPSDMSYLFTNTTGGLSSYTVSYTTYTVQTNFGCPVQEYPPSSANLITRITRPDGSHYDFAYEPTPGYSNHTTGRIASITLPAGGTISYSYTGGNNGITCGDGTTAGLSRTVNPANAASSDASGTWNYSRSGSGTAWTTTITEPAVSPNQGNQTVVDFRILGKTFLETKKVVKQADPQGNLTTLLTVNTCYNGAIPDCTGTAITQAINERNVYAQPAGLASSSRVRTLYNASALPTDVYEYDYGTSTPTRQTSTVYASLGRVVDRPSTVTVYDGLGDVLAKTTYNYDETSLTARTVNQHVSVSGPRGNLTSIKRRVNASADEWTYLTYDETGNVLTVQDAGGHTTALTYSSTLAYGFATQTQAPDTGSVHHISGADYDLATGLLTSSTDQNGNRTQVAYDGSLRPSAISYADGGQTVFAYPNAYTVNRTDKITASLSRASTTLIDGLGRTKQAQLSSDPDGADYTDYSYNAAGQTSCVSNPHRTVTASTDGSTCSTYDALGRALQATRQDGSIATASYSANTVTTTDEAGNSRKMSRDGLGRLIQVDEPSPLVNHAATNSSGTVSISGNEQTTSAGGSNATSGSGSVLIEGAENSTWHPNVVCDLYDYDGYCVEWIDNGWMVYDGGTVSITVNAFTKSVSYDSSSTTSSIASTLAGAFNGDGSSPVSAAASGGTVYLTAKAAGADTNYSLSGTSETYDPTDFGGPSFYTTPSGASLAGGSNAIPPTTIYDQGSVWITVNGSQKTVSYGQGSTSSSVASTLASAINGDSNCPVSASASGSSVTLTSKSAGASTNYSLSANSSTSQQAYFSAPSFSASASGFSLSGGVDAYATGGLASPYTTLYTYDPLDNLTCVEQHGNGSGTGCSSDPSSDAISAWRVRRFSYDSVSRLLSESNPETGTIRYSYNSDGLLSAKTDGRNVTTSYSYDTNHRLTGKTFSNSDPPITYYYDQASYNGLTIANGVGLRTGMSDASGTAGWTYDVMGRVLAEQRTLNSVTKRILYSYNLNGSLATLTYPSGRTLTYTTNGAGRMTSAVDTPNSINYATNARYTPAGEISSVQNGATLISTFYYNNRLQPCRISATSSGTAATGCTDSTNIGNILDLSYNFNAGSADNGNVMAITNNRSTTRSVSFSYDQLNRLASAQTSSNLWGTTYAYDAWGNLLHKDQISGKIEGEYLQQSADVHNRLSGFSYDNAGNMTANGSASYSYDAESRMGSTAGVTYTYDGDGQRVKKTGGTLYWTGIGTSPIAESDLSGNIQREFVFFAGQRVARLDVGSGTVHYFFANHLGSTTVVTSSTGTIEDESDYYPFGTERIITSGSGNTYKFANLENDGESGLNHSWFRQLSGALGRWMSPDPAGLAAVDLSDPQSWNRYTYVMNRPTTLTDPRGLLACGGEEECVAQDVENKGGEPPIGVTSFEYATGLYVDPMAWYIAMVQAAFQANRDAAQNKDNKKDTGLIVTPTPEIIDIPEVVKSLLSFFGIELGSATVAHTTDAPKEIPLPKELLWIDQIVNGHGWEDHGQYDFDSKEEYKQMVVDTVQNAKGGAIVRNPKGRTGVTGFWNDSEGFVVWHDKNHPDQGTALYPDDADRYKREWGFK